MASEAKRGCGYRKVGGLYLVGNAPGAPCDRLPLALTVCPTCSCGIKQGRGWTWVNVAGLVDGPHKISTHNDVYEHPCREARDQSCTFCAAPELMGRAGLLWIGEQFYKTPGEFLAEGVSLGFSRRINTVPKGFEIGKTWVLLAHSKAFPTVETVEPLPGMLLAPETVIVNKPGLFYVWLPQRIEKICTESQRGSEEVLALEKRGINPVFIPDNDKDHQGTAYDKPDEAGEAAKG